MAKLNYLACAALAGNTGIGNCSLIPAHIVAVLLVPNSFVIKEADAANLQTFLEDAAQDASKAKRIYPINNITAFTDNSGDAQNETTGYGDVIPLRDGNYNWTFRYIKGGICLHKNLRKFNGQNLSALFVDANGVVFGRMTKDGLSGVPLASFYANKWTASDSSAVAGFTFSVTFASAHINENFGFVKDEELDITAVAGLQDITLSAVGSQTTTILTVAAAVGCGGENLYDLFADELAAGTLWSVTDTVTGAAATITSVAKNDGLKAFTITLSAARSNAVRVSLKDPATLAAADLVGFESDAVVIPM